MIASLLAEVAGVEPAVVVESEYRHKDGFVILPSPLGHTSFFENQRASRMAGDIKKNI